MLDIKTIGILLAAIALCVVVGVVYYRLVTQERSGKQHAAPVQASPQDSAPTRDRRANPAFLRSLRTAVSRRGLTLLLPDPDKTPFSALIVGPYGITAVYAVDYDGTIYGSSDDRWVQTRDGVRRTFENPLRSAETARRALREQINAGKFRPFMIEAKTVLTSRRAELAIPRNTPYFTAKSFCGYVRDSGDLGVNRRVDEQAVKAFLQEHFC